MILATAFLCLAINVYEEARSEPINGQFAVAQVTWNRAGHNASNVCGVVTKPHQFSWTRGRLRRVHGKWVTKFEPKDKRSWTIAQVVARSIMRNKSDMLGGATFYHADYVSPKWKNSFTVVEKIGRHIFYKAG